MKNKVFIVMATWLLFAIYPAVLFSLDIGFTTPQNKVYFEAPTDFSGKIATETQINVAGNEYEATQMVLFPKENISSVTVEASDLARTGGSEIIPASDITINPVAYVNLLEPKVAGDRIGWIPDPLLPKGPLNLSNGVLQPYLITVYAKNLARAGDYSGSITVKSGATVLATLTLKVKVYNFSLPKVSKFKTSNLASWSAPSTMWPNAPSMTWEDRKQHMLDLADLSFKNKLPITGFLANGLISWNWDGTGNTTYSYPTHDNFVFNPTRTGELIDYMLDKGANHFFIGLTSNVYLYPELTAARIAKLKQYLTEYRTYLLSRNLLSMAYVYGVDEPWDSAVQQTKDTYTFIKNNVGNDVKFYQNTNQNNGTIIGALLNYFDALDINLGWFNVTNAAQYRNNNPSKLGDLWWNVNIWPDSHPNLYVEYPLADARILGPMSFKYGINGLMHWDICSMYGMTNYHPITANETRVNWDVDLHSLDGTLAYPGVDYDINSSLRFESLRDGLEDQEYLYLLREKEPTNSLLGVDTIQGLTQFEQDPAKILEWRDSIALALAKFYPDDGSDPETGSPGDNERGALYSVVGGCSIGTSDINPFAVISLLLLLIILMQVKKNHKKQRYIFIKGR